MKTVGIFILFLIFILIALPVIAQEEFIPLKKPEKKNVLVYSTQDKDFDKIEDLLEEEIILYPEQESRVIIVLKEPYTQGQIKVLEELNVTLVHTYEFASYGFSGKIQMKEIRRLTNLLGDKLEIIEKDKPVELFLDKSAQIVRARNITWNVYGFKGDANFSVAVLDTGIDDSHLDLYGYSNLSWLTSNKLIGWKDTTADNALTPVDYHGHGSHVASTVAGTGASYGNGTITNINTTFSYVLPTAGWCYVDEFEVKTSGKIILNGTVSSGSFLIILKNPAGTEVARDSTSPWYIEYTTSTTGMWQAWGCNPGGAKGRPFSIIETAPYTTVGDGNNLFTGIAPSARLTGVKIFQNDGTGWVSDMLEAFDWVIANKQTYRIKVASMSAGLTTGATDTTLRNAANNVVKNGTVFVIAAGNDFPTYKIGDPALAEKVITVGATNDDDQMTDYSSNGPTGSGKPDVVAPGGSFNVKSQITAVDTNDDDAETQTFPDYRRNDYTTMSGTSMATPHVAGEAALIIQAMESQGQTWLYTEAETLKVKMLILMTAIETNQTGESSNNPSLDIGGKDLVEGYGRVNADGAIEAVTMSHTIGTSQSDTLNKLPTYKNVWARKVSLSSGATYEFNLTVPSSGDFDLYLYNATPNSVGNPVILNKSVSASLDTDEKISYSPSVTGEYYVVVKSVSGNGQFTFSSVTVGKFISITLLGYPVNFGNLDPGATDSAASANPYTIRVNPETNVNVDLYQKGDDYTYGSYTLGIGNMTWNKVNNVAASLAITKTYSSVETNVTPNTNVTIYYWIGTPSAQRAGNYNTTIYVKAVETGTSP